MSDTRREEIARKLTALVADLKPEQRPRRVILARQEVVDAGFSNAWARRIAAAANAANNRADLDEMITEYADEMTAGDADDLLSPRELAAKIPQRGFGHT